MFHLEDAKRRTVNKRLPQVKFEIWKYVFCHTFFQKVTKKAINKDHRFQT